MYEFKKSQNIIETYWGTIRTLINEPEYCMKSIWMWSNSQSSLEFHVDKKETYYIESGTLYVGIREGRAENKMIKLKHGDVFTIYPGQMHMRITKGEPCRITEVSTQDNKYDTYFVEDGKSYNHEVVE